MRRVGFVLLAVCAACGPGGSRTSATTTTRESAGERPADTIIVNGKIFTGAPAPGEVEALAIRDGRVLVAGTEEEVRARAGQQTEVIDAGGRRVVPGLTDAHAHFSAVPDGVWLDLGGGPTPNPDPAALLDAVATEASKADSKGWIYATIGARVLDDHNLRAAALDEASPDRPVMLEAFSGHGTIMNTRALKELGVDTEHDPPGGWCERDADGRCTGLLREMAEFDARRTLRMSAGLSRAAADYRQAADDYVRWGVTAVDDMELSYTTERCVAALTRAEIPIRWSIYRAPMLKHSLDEAWAHDLSGLKMPDRVRLAGIKWFMDGTPIERDAARRSDYADRPGWKGRLDYTPAQVRRILKEGLARGEQLALHTVGDRALALVFSTMRELAPPSRWRAFRLRIEHGDGLQPDLWKQAAELGVVVTQNPLHFAPGPIAKRLTEKERASFQPVRSLLEAGVHVALGSDADGAARNPYLNIMLAVKRQLTPAEAITVRQALTAYTSGGAYAGKEDKERGTLQPGKLADLAILSQDILAIPVERLPATRSILTMVGGTVVYREPDPRGEGDTK